MPATIDLYILLDNPARSALIANPAARFPAATPDFVVRDTVLLRVRFYRRLNPASAALTLTDLGEDVAVAFGGKATADYATATDFLFYSSLARTVDGDDISWQASLNLNTVEFIAAFASATEVPLTCEVQVTDEGDTQTVSQFGAKGVWDVIRGDELPPSDAVPPYPTTPTADSVLAGAADGLSWIKLSFAALWAKFIADISLTFPWSRVSGKPSVLTAGLASGGGDLSADRTITVPAASADETVAGLIDTKAVTPAGNRVALWKSVQQALFSRIGEPLRVMSDPPLVTCGTGGAASEITSSVLYSPAYPQFRYNAHGMAFPSYATGFWGRSDYAPFSVHFATTAEDFEVLEYGEQRGARRYLFNGELVSDRIFQPRVTGSKNADGLTYLRRFRFGERSDFTEPTWLAAYLRPTQDGKIQWTAIDPTPGGYLVNESAWTGASGSLSSTPPTGWSMLGSAQCQLVASDASETNVLRVVATAASDALRITGVVPSPTTVALKMRVRTVGAGSWTLRLQGGAINNFVTIAGADFPTWHTIYVPISTSSVGADGLGFVASAAGELWIDQVQLFEWSNGMATDWAANTKYFKGDVVEPTVATGFVYRADVVRPEMKRVRCDIGKYGLFGGVCLPPGEALLPGVVERRDVAAFVGDSFTNGGDSIGGDNAFGLAGFDAWCYALADELRWECWPDGQSGTGYIAVGASAKFRDRLPAIYPLNPSIVVLAGGFNDRTLTSWTATDVADEFALCVAAIRANLPNALILAVGPWTYRVSATEPTNGLLQVNDALRERAASLAVPYVDVVESGWLTGDWTVAASGNANQLFADSGVHPNRLGHRMLGHQIARALRRLVAGTIIRDEWMSLYASGAWAGAGGSTQPTGWNKFATPTFAVGTHDGQADALEITADAANEGMDRAIIPAGAYGYNWRKVRLTFKAKITAGEVVCNSTGSAIPSGSGHRYISARVRPIGGSWSSLSGITLGRSSSLNWTPFLNTSNAGTWVEIEIIANAAQAAVQFYSRSAAATWYLKDLSVELYNAD